MFIVNISSICIQIEPSLLMFYSNLFWKSRRFCTFFCHPNNIYICGMKPLTKSFLVVACGTVTWGFYSGIYIYFEMVISFKILLSVAGDRKSKWKHFANENGKQRIQRSFKISSLEICHRKFDVWHQKHQWFIIFSFWINWDMINMIKAISS